MGLSQVVGQAGLGKDISATGKSVYTRSHGRQHEPLTPGNCKVFDKAGAIIIPATTPFLWDQRVFLLFLNFTRISHLISSSPHSSHSGHGLCSSSRSCPVCNMISANLDLSWLKHPAPRPHTHTLSPKSAEGGVLYSCRGMLSNPLLPIFPIQGFWLCEFLEGESDTETKVWMLRGTDSRMRYFGHQRV